MNTQNVDNSPKIMKETKNKIKVDFERTPLLERLKAKFISMSFVGNVVWYLFRFTLLLGIAYIVLFPFYTKIAGSFMIPEDFVNVTVRLIPTQFTLQTWREIFLRNDYIQAFFNTFLLSGSTAFIQTIVCSFIAYGLAKFRFKGSNALFFLVIFTMVVPHPTLQFSMFMNIRYFDIFGIFQFLGGGGITIFGKTFLKGIIDLAPEGSKIWTETGLNLMDTYWPLIILSFTGLAFKNGLYIFMLRQFFRGVPDELEESAYIDGSGVVRTFVQIILPLSIPMMITVFLFAFSWQWTDDFYTELFFITSSASKSVILMPDVVAIPDTLVTNYAGQNLYYTAIRNTCGLMIILPLLVLYLFCQKYIVQGIERSGITG